MDSRRDDSPAGADAAGPKRGESLSAASYAGLGLQFVVALLVFLFAGQWIDARLGTSPVFLMLGVFLGAGGAFYSIYRRLMAEQEREEMRRRESGTHRR